MRTALLVLGCCSFMAARVQAQAPDAEGVLFFEKKIRPVLAEHCYRCHSQEAQKNKKLKGGLFLDSSQGLRKGGESGPALVPRQPQKSLLLKALRHQGDLHMPPQGKLPERVIADFESWIAQGAPAPNFQAVPDAFTKLSSIDWDQARKFWAFQPPRKHPLPAIKKQAWPRRDIDRFLLAEMEKHGLEPVGPAGKIDLIRRATFDLLGLPPAPEEIAAYLKDDSPDAFAKVVDRLLQSPHYGERWGRYWLDVARYADDKALATSQVRPHSYRYRDWVVRAFNQDMPYDRFVRLQLAGDLLAEPADPFVRLAGLGFQGLGAEYHRGNFTAQVMADELDDRVDTLSRGLLGLTVACARCHDHKYDPIPTVDYYSLAAAYQGSTLMELPAASPEAVKRFQSWQQELKKKEGQLAQWLNERGRALKKSGKAKINPATIVGLLGEADRKTYESRKAEIDQWKKNPPPAPVMIHGIKGGGQAMRVNIRGNVERLGDPAPPGFLRILQWETKLPGKGPFTRLELAEAIASTKNPLTARVYVNRVWQHHFGRALVGSPSNFGRLGEPPTHPELLDTLAVLFMEAGWSTKWLHREIMLSAAYQSGATLHANNVARDVDNRYLWRMQPRRLDLEAWRDALLAVSGRLDPALAARPLI
jgi:cytochrome c553